MQNAATLIDLGMRTIPSGEYLYRGVHQKFTAKVIDYNGPVFVQVFLVSEETDNRPNSPQKGLRFRNLIKDCCSNGSVEACLAKFDVPTNRLVVDAFQVRVIG